MKNLIFTTDTGRRLLITLIVLLFCFIASAQNKPPTHYIDGNIIVRIDTVKKSRKTISKKTNLTYKIKETVYPVYIGSKGGYYIIRTSKKTGKEYKQYLKVK